MGRVVLNDGMGDGRRRRELIIHRQHDFNAVGRQHLQLTGAGQR
jgi:hypothetical protein